MFILLQQEEHKKNKEHAVHKMEQHLMGDVKMEAEQGRAGSQVVGKSNF